MKKVLIVDDSLYMRTMIESALSSANYEIVGHAATGEEAIEKALELEPDIITLDNVLPDMIGIDVLKILIGEEEIKSKIIMISAVGQDNIIDEGLSNGALDYLVKPFTPEILIDKINSL
ncbi:MAG: response regulator [Vicingaceae bacterium]|nr:response regulator [Vicingaceae bacterium]